MRDERSDHEWEVIRPMLPNKPRKATCANLWLAAAAGQSSAGPQWRCGIPCAYYVLTFTNSQITKHI